LNGMAGVTVNRSKAVISVSLLWNMGRRSTLVRPAAAGLVAIVILSAIVFSGKPAVAIDPSESCFGLTGESPDEAGAQPRIAHVVGDASVELSSVLPPACEREPNFCKDVERLSAQPGEIVVVTRQASGFICAHRFPGGPRNEGWLPLSRLKLADPTQAAPPLSAWVGTWHGSDQAATITIRLADNNTLRAEGEASWQGQYAGPNTGNFDSTAKPVSNFLTLTDYSVCHVSLALLPSSLAVVDNAQCGGMNVRFSGFYERTSNGR
jgi:hypothetical protein